MQKEAGLLLLNPTSVHFIWFVCANQLLLYKLADLELFLKVGLSP